MSHCGSRAIMDKGKRRQEAEIVRETGSLQVTGEEQNMWQANSSRHPKTMGHGSEMGIEQTGPCWRLSMQC